MEEELKELQEEIEFLEDKCLHQEREIGKLKADLEKARYDLAMKGNKQQSAYDALSQMAAAQQYAAFGYYNGNKTR